LNIIIHLDLSRCSKGQKRELRHSLQVRNDKVGIFGLFYEFVINGPIGLFNKTAAFGKNKRAVQRVELTYLYDINKELTTPPIIFMTGLFPFFGSPDFPFRDPFLSSGGGCVTAARVVEKD